MNPNNYIVISAVAICAVVAVVFVFAAVKWGMEK